MQEAWIAFIVLCNAQMVCDGTRKYADNAEYSLELCRGHARGWAIQMKALTDRNYAFGCKKNDYEPPEVK